MKKHPKSYLLGVRFHGRTNSTRQVWDPLIDNIQRNQHTRNQHNRKQSYKEHLENALRAEARWRIWPHIYIYIYMAIHIYKNLFRTQLSGVAAWRRKSLCITPCPLRQDTPPIGKKLEKIRKSSKLRFDHMNLYRISWGFSWCYPNKPKPHLNDGL